MKWSCGAQLATAIDTLFHSHLTIAESVRMWPDFWLAVGDYPTLLLCTAGNESATAMCVICWFFALPCNSQMVLPDMATWVNSTGWCLCRCVLPDEPPPLHHSLAVAIASWWPPPLPPPTRCMIHTLLCHGPIVTTTTVSWSLSLSPSAIVVPR
jgi:hypothetical protein